MPPPRSASSILAGGTQVGTPSSPSTPAVRDRAGGYRGQMAVLVNPNGLLGTAYMAAIMPFRHLIVYPPLMREIGQRWRALQVRP